MSVTEITSRSQWNDLVASTPYVALQAHAKWCGPCKAIAPLFDKHAAALGSPSFTFARFDIDDVGDLAQDLGIASVPAFFFFEKGDDVPEKVRGANPGALKKMVDTWGEKSKKADAVSASS